jgi:hypothetical protein
MTQERYFDILPNFKYINPVQEGGKREQYVEVKNLFTRVKLNNSVLGNITSFQGYSILDGERPDNVAEKLYEDQDLDWVVLLSANITSVQDQWPLSSRLLYEIAEEKYGTALNEVNHYETTEVRDSNGRLILPGGLTVDQGFRIPDPNNALLDLDPTVAVSNWLVETRKNNKKRAIQVLRPQYVNQLIDDANDLLQYQESSQFTDDDGKVAFNDLI